MGSRQSMDAVPVYRKCQGKRAFYQGGCKSLRKLGRLALGVAHAGSKAKTWSSLWQLHIMSLTCSQSLNSSPLVANVQAMSKPCLQGWPPPPVPCLLEPWAFQPWVLQPCLLAHRVPTQTLPTAAGEWPLLLFRSQAQRPTLLRYLLPFPRLRDDSFSLP